MTSPTLQQRRADLLARLRAKIARGEAVIGGGAGTGLWAKCEEAGGIDLIVICNSARYRMAGRGSLSGLMAYGNANDTVLASSMERLPTERALTENTRRFTALRTPSERSAGRVSGGDTAEPIGP